LAGQISELACRTLPGDFRIIDPRAALIFLLDAGLIGLWPLSVANAPSGP
jgi:hypothetical protein